MAATNYKVKKGLQSPFFVYFLISGSIKSRCKSLRLRL